MAKLELRLRTWIPQDRVFFIQEATSKLYFKGDNRRSAAWSTLAYRTSHSFVIDTSPTNYSVSATPKVNPTTAIFETVGGNTTTETHGQDSTCLTYSKSVKNGDLYLSVKCHCANPAVLLAPAIDYEFTLKVTRTGSVRITGKHDGFPAYEFWRNIEGKNGGPELVYTHNPLDTGDTILSLGPPMEYSIDRGLSYTS
jgi:hypothetical protein